VAKSIHGIDTKVSEIKCFKERMEVAAVATTKDQEK
jgi:hypothetical protein